MEKPLPPALKSCQNPLSAALGLVPGIRPYPPFLRHVISPTCSRTHQSALPSPSLEQTRQFQSFRAFQLIQKLTTTQLVSSRAVQSEIGIHTYQRNGPL